MGRARFTLVLTVLVLMSLACSFSTGSQKPTSTPVPINTPEAQTTDTPEEPAPTAEPAASPTAEAPEGAVTSLDGVKTAIVQFEAQGSFVDPEVGQVLNAAGRGSGFIIDPSGLAITNNHVVTGAALIKVWVGGEKESRNARVIGVSECWDLALVDIEGDGYPYLTIYDDEVKPGMEVYAAGFPLGDPEYTLTKGIISKAKADGRTNWTSVPDTIEHDAKILPGNSGGPLVNTSGQVVGINYAGRNSTDQNYAILASHAKGVVEDLKNGDYESMGINGQAVANEDGSLTGIWVSSVKSGSPADKAGVKGGDIITKMEGLVLATDGTMADYCDIMRTRNATDVISIQVLRFSTQEVLEGQFNGKALETSFSFANQLANEAPQGNAQAGSSNGEYSRYVTIQDDYGSIQMDVPAEWSDIDGSAWIVDGEVIGASIMAAHDVMTFNNTYVEPGVFFAVSDDLATQAGYIQLLDAYSQLFREDCTFEGRYDYEDSAYEGKYEIFSGCAGADNTLIVLSARPIQNKTAFLITLYVNVMSEADLNALDQILATFDVIGSLP